jgi:hypothetical protein
MSRDEGEAIVGRKVGRYGAGVHSQEHRTDATPSWCSGGLRPSRKKPQPSNPHPVPMSSRSQLPGTLQRLCAIDFNAAALHDSVWRVKG